jgi:hypothetical protein
VPVITSLLSRTSAPAPVTGLSSRLVPFSV